MIEYVYYDTWFIWNPGVLAITIIMSSVLYLILLSEESIKVARPRWIASIPVVAGIISIGLYCIISIICYIIVSFYIDRFKEKRG